MQYTHYKTGRLYAALTEEAVQKLQVTVDSQFRCLARMEDTHQIVPVFEESDGTFVILTWPAVVNKKFVVYYAVQSAEDDMKPGVWIRTKQNFHDFVNIDGELIPRFKEVEVPSVEQAIEDLEAYGIFYEKQEDGTYLVGTDDEPEIMEGHTEADLWKAWKARRQNV